MTTQESTTTPHKIKQLIGTLSLSEFIWPPVIIFLTVTSFYSVIGGDPNSLLVYTFSVLCPGMAFVRLLDIDNYLVEWSMAIGFSLTLNAILSFIMVYFDLWSPEGAFFILAAGSLLGAGLQIKGWYSHWEVLASAKE